MPYSCRSVCHADTEGLHAKARYLEVYIHGRKIYVAASSGLRLDTEEWQTLYSGTAMREVSTVHDVSFSAGGLENLLHHTGNTPAGRGSCDMNDMDGNPHINTVEADYLDYCCSVLQHL